MARVLSIEELTEELKIRGYELLEICPSLEVYKTEHGGYQVFEKHCPYEEQATDRFEQWKGIKYPIRLGCPRIYKGDRCFEIRDRTKQN